MKIRNIVTALLIICCISSVILYSRAAQPTTSKEMILKTIKNADSPQLIRELISHMKESLEKDTDHFPELIAEVDSFTTTVSDPATQAVLHSMLAQMYKNYYQSQGWIINQRTSIEGYIPDDLREWSANLFQAKIREELALSLQPEKVLQETPADRFQEIMEPGKDSPELRPTLYDFLAYRAIMIQPSPSVYEQLIQFRKTQPEKKALLLAELDYLEYAQEDRKKYELQLDSLLQVYAGQDYSVEIILRKLENLSAKKWRSENQDSIQSVQYALAKETISRFPDYDRIGIIRNWLQGMEAPSLNIQTENTVYPGDPLKIRLTYNNVENIQVSVYESLKTAESILLDQSNNTSKKTNTYGKQVVRQTYTLNAPNTYTPVDTILSIPMTQPGIYECVVTAGSGEIKLSTLFSVSRLSALHRDTPLGIREILVTDLKTGKPQENAEVIYYKWTQRQLQREGSVKTDRNGLASLPLHTDYYNYKAILPGDTAMLFTPVSGSWAISEDVIEDKKPSY
ncbi:MAG: hypothetical protein LUG51_04490 [Tannerellaceae bacterium]|nr:hypothetical protein [Tannerellaceae bacterium]